MEFGLSILLNKIFKTELELLYGYGSSVRINNFEHNKRKSLYIINCILYIGDVKLYEELGEDGLNFLIQKSLPYLSLSNKKIMTQISFDLL